MTTALIYRCGVANVGGFPCHQTAVYALAGPSKTGQLSCRQHLAKAADELMAPASNPAEGVLKVVKFTPPAAPAN